MSIPPRKSLIDGSAEKVYNIKECLIMAMSAKKRRETMKANEFEYLKVIADIEYELITSLQLYVVNGVLYDGQNVLLYNNEKYIFYPKNMVSNSTGIVPFDPINNPKLMQFLFNIYLRKYQMENDINIQSFFFTPIDEFGKSCVAARIRPGYDIVSDPFKSESLRFISFIAKQDEWMTASRLPEIDEYLVFLKEERMLERKKG